MEKQINLKFKGRTNLSKITRTSVLMMQHRVLFPFYSKNWKNKYLQKASKMLITTRYLLVRINLNKLEEREIGNRAGVFPFAFLVWFFLIVIGRQFLNPGTNYRNLNVWLEQNNCFAVNFVCYNRYDEIYRVISHSSH